MSEQELAEMIQKYKKRYNCSIINGDYGLWEFLANSLAQDLISAKNQISYLKTKLSNIENMK